MKPCPDSILMRDPEIEFFGAFGENESFEIPEMLDFV
jgi:hypothetical protein